MSQVEVDRADRTAIEQAARRLRDDAIRDGYAGRPAKHIAFSFALVLDELGRHVRDLDEDLRRHVMAACRDLSAPPDH